MIVRWLFSTSADLDVLYPTLAMLRGVLGMALSKVLSVQFSVFTQLFASGYKQQKTSFLGVRAHV
jgi:hypothetical protein